MLSPAFLSEHFGHSSYHYSEENLAKAIGVLESIAQEAKALALPLIIALDGSAAVGKTQIVKMLETFLGYRQMSKGLLARVFTWVYQTQGFANKSLEEFAQVCRELTIKPAENNQIRVESNAFGSVCLNPDGFDDETGLRSNLINKNVSELSGQTPIVELIHDLVREIAEQAVNEGQPLVIDGRDSVRTFRKSKPRVAKIYLYAQEEEIRFRAGERYKQMMARDYPEQPINQDDVAAAGEKAVQRTREDIQKANGSLASLKEAYELLADGHYDGVIDTTELSVQETFYYVLLIQLRVIEQVLKHKIIQGLRLN